MKPPSERFFADLPAWHSHPDYNEDLALALQSAFDSIYLGVRSIASLQLALDAVRPFKSFKVAPQQRQSLCFVQASCLAELDTYSAAVVWLDEALDLALMGGDTWAAIELLRLRANINRARLKLLQGAADIRDALTLLAALAGGPDEHVDPPLELDLVTMLAGYEYFLGHFDEADNLLAQARLLLPQADAAGVEAGAIEWVYAHLFRARRLPEQALRPALAAASAYTEAGAAISAARAQGLVSEVALDLAELVPPTADRLAFLILARSHLEIATELAQEARDPVGVQLLALTRIRYSRLSRPEEDRVAAIGAVIRESQEVDDDVALRAQAYTAMGDEYVALGQAGTALDWYRQAEELATRAEIPAIALTARRALLRADEMQVNHHSFVRDPQPNDQTDKTQDT